MGAVPGRRPLFMRLFTNDPAITGEGSTPCASGLWTAPGGSGLGAGRRSAWRRRHTLPHADHDGGMWLIVSPPGSSPAWDGGWQGLTPALSSDPRLESRRRLPTLPRRQVATAQGLGLVSGEAASRRSSGPEDVGHLCGAGGLPERRLVIARGPPWPPGRAPVRSSGAKRARIMAIPCRGRRPTVPVAAPWCSRMGPARAAPGAVPYRRGIPPPDVSLGPDPGGSGGRRHGRDGRERRPARPSRWPSRWSLPAPAAWA